MHFLQPSEDTPMLAELKEAGILTPDVIERIDRELNRPESGSLDQFLLAGAGHVAEREWLSWLIRRHGCHRFGRVAWSDEAAEWPTAESDSNQPYRRGCDGHALVAVLRPDRWATTEARFSGQPLHRAAATLGEVRELRAARARWELGAGTNP